MNLVVGATGPIGLGGEICRLLRKQGKPVRALVRPTSSADRVSQLRSAGVEIVVGDVIDPSIAQGWIGEPLTSVRDYARRVLTERS
jgi:uncharacterized protein YbjT (DUF2867 family)